MSTTRPAASERQNRAALFRVERTCRSCGGSQLHPIFSFGWTPLADRLLTRDQLNQAELTAPLELVLCPECTLVQINATVRPEELFCNDYPYYSSVSPYLMRHFGDSARALIERKGLNRDSLVIEAASNDGYMLRNFVERGIPVLGIDPASGPAGKARESGVETLNTFFSRQLATAMRAEGTQADLFLANNVLAHVADLNGFVEGIKILLKQDGLAVIEAPYLLDLVSHVEFDTIYHQHLCYFSVTALSRLFAQHGLSLNDVQRIPIHGGSLRLFVEPKADVSPTVQNLMAHEAELGIGQARFYHRFAARLEALRLELGELLWDLKLQGKTIAGYGAAAKGTMLLSYFRIDKRQLDFIADLSPHKQGRYLPINHLPIEPASALLERRPDYVLLLAWNFANEILEQQQEYRQKGGRFIVPVPELRVV